MSDQIGGYSLETLLGSGDMGATYRALPPDGSAPVALKLLDRVDCSNEMKRSAAAEVIEFAATLQHPRLHPILGVLDAPDDEARLAIAMPLASKGSLADVLKQRQSLPPKVCLNLIAQVASGLHFLHGQEVAHGSLKPTNILLDDEGNAALTDLSMAHLRELGFVPPEPTEQHLYFMPPEREYHAPPEVIGDVFSMAVLAYLLLAGELPFDHPEPEARGIVPQGQLSPPMAAVLRRAVNPHLRLRYQSLGEFMSALKDAAQGKVDRETEKVFGVDESPPSGSEDR